MTMLKCNSTSLPRYSIFTTYSMRRLGLLDSVPNQLLGFYIVTDGTFGDFGRPGECSSSSVFNWSSYYRKNLPFRLNGVARLGEYTGNAGRC